MKSKRWKRRNRVRNERLVRAYLEIEKGYLPKARYSTYIICPIDLDCLFIKTAGKHYLTTVVN